MRSIQRSSSLPLLLCAMFLASSACSGRSGPRTDPDYGEELTDTVPAFRGHVPKNIFMISMDTFRVDHLDRAPFLSAMVEAGFRATDTVQCSNWTYASTSCTLLGRYNEQAGMIPQLVPDFDGRWGLGTPFLASWLHEAGYFSVIGSTNGWLGEAWGNTGGYDQSFHPHDGSAWGAYSEARSRLDFELKKGETDRWLLHVHLTEPHASYDPPGDYLHGLERLQPVPWDLTDRDVQYDVSRDQWPAMTEEERALLEEHLRVRYAGEIAYMDDQIFQMIASMDFDGLLDDTLVVLWTDHGEAFWEHGYQTHAYTLFREENDALLFMWAKNIVPSTWDGPVASIDLAPTLLALEGLPLPPEVTGIPIGSAPADRARFANTIARLGPMSSIQKNNWKMIFRWTGSTHLYDLASDPGETEDLYRPEDPSPEAIALWSELAPMVELQSSRAQDKPLLWPPELGAP